MKLPDLSHEIELWNQGYTIIGIDEVGRGAFAGPVYVGGVIFKPTNDERRLTKLLSYGINDSKKLTAKKREELAAIIKLESLSYHISSIDVSIINKIGIGKAAFRAMREVVKNLTKNQELTTNCPTFVLVDGFNIKHLRGISLKNQKAIVGGDGISLSIAAASIIAKVARDAHMIKLSTENLKYYWDKNKGYGTLAHRTAIGKFGACDHHRKAFVKNFIPKI